MQKVKLLPKSTKAFESKLFRIKLSKQPTTPKILFKMKMFNDVESKVKSRLNSEKEKLITRQNWNQTSSSSNVDNKFRNMDKYDEIIAKVEGEIKSLN